MLLYKNSQHLPLDTNLWRYVSLQALIATISSTQLRLTRLDKFDDPFEGSLPFAEHKRISQNFLDAQDDSPPNRARAIQATDVRRRVRSWADEMRMRHLASLMCAHASCWRSGFESEGMWRLYCQDQGVPGQGVAIRTTVRKMFAVLEHEEAYFSPVAYRAYHEGEAFSLELDKFFHKRRGFAHEQEIRVLTYDVALAYEFVRYFAGFTDLEPKQLSEYKYLRFPATEVIERIVISPYASDKYEDEVARSIEEAGPQLLPLIELSELSERQYARLM